ncbi:hypothetical protein GCM10023166_21740 [Paeniglutamicibacter cryotolerans]
MLSTRSDSALNTRTAGSPATRPAAKNLTRGEPRVPIAGSRPLTLNEQSAFYTSPSTVNRVHSWSPLSSYSTVTLGYPPSVRP